MGKSYTHHDSTKAISKQPRDHFVPGKRLCSKTNPRKLQYSNAIMLSWRSRDAAPSGGGPRGGGPRGAAALMRRDAPRPSRTWHAPSAWRASCARRPLRSSTLGARAVRRARAMRCARHGAPRRALPQHLLHVAVLGAAGRRRAERRCVGRCASPWTGIGITLLAPRRCKLLAVQVEINIAADHACCARKDTVVLATLRDRGCVYRR